MESIREDQQRIEVELLYLERNGDDGINLVLEGSDANGENRWKATVTLASPPTFSEE